MRFRGICGVLRSFSGISVGFGDISGMHRRFSGAIRCFSQPQGVSGSFEGFSGFRRIPGYLKASRGFQKASQVVAGYFRGVLEYLWGFRRFIAKGVSGGLREL